MIVGIDLGTTNSGIGVWRDGAVELIPNSLGHRLTPSAVSVDAENGGALLVGLAARERQVSHPDLTATTFKRYMGTNRVTKLGDMSFRAEELSALVLRALKRDAEVYLGQPVTEAVITVPAYFNDKQRQATRRAGELAGLKVDRLVNEPTAAALAYGIHEAAGESRFLVFDLGGGTFDVSIVEMFEGVVEVRASTGDNRLGGEDFNEVLADGFLDRLQEAKPLARNSPLFRERLRAAAEVTRRGLTDQPAVEMSVPWEGECFRTEIGVEDFEAWSDGLVARLKEPVLRSLRDSGLKADQLAEVVLVGGATRMPIVRRTVTKMFGRFPSHAVHPDEAVAIGAAIQAGLKSRDAALKELVLTDVCPYTLGIEISERSQRGEVAHGIFAPVIERNTLVPASRVRTFSTMMDNQRKVDIKVFQGEALRVTDNIPLGVISISVPPKPAGNVAVEVRFSYDVNGLLQVDVQVPETGERRELLIVDDDGMTAEEIQRRCEVLADLKVHPRDDDANRHALARAERCFEISLGEGRDFISRCIREFQSALESQDPRTAEHARKALLATLDAIEGETWL